MCIMFYTENDNKRLLAKVKRKLTSLGFKLDGAVRAQVDVGIAGILSFDRCAGYWMDGMIHMPLIRLNRLWSAQTDYVVLLHEAGHAIVRTKRFRMLKDAFVKAFGGSYGESVTGMQNSKDCVSDYATTNTQEDFAETFCAYAQCNGRMPKGLSEPLQTKWLFVARLAGEAA